MNDRQATGVPGLDQLLGGGLIPGTLTVVMGSTGAGKTQIGLQIANVGLAQEGRRGILFDVCSRGDSQNHVYYAQRMFNWTPQICSPDEKIDWTGFFQKKRSFGDYLHVFGYHGRRVTRQDLEWEDWRLWQAELNAKLQTTIGFFYGNLIHKTKRIVVDGFEPVDRPHESIQFQLFEYVYHQILRKDPEWVARDLFREHYRENADEISRHGYDHQSVSCVLLYTSHETMLDDLISRPLTEGDVLSNANTLIYIGKVRDGNRISRGLYVAKHRGSRCSDAIVPYEIDDQGVAIRE